VIICNYCKKPGHKLIECKKWQYVNSKKTDNQGNQQQPAVSSGRPVGDIRIGVPTKCSTSSKN